MLNGDFLLRVAHTYTALLCRCYTLIPLEINCRTWWCCLKCVIMYLARDIPPFVMYCVYGESGSSLLIESTDSMIYVRVSKFCVCLCVLHLLENMLHSKWRNDQLKFLPSHLWHRVNHMRHMQHLCMGLLPNGNM